MQQPATITYTTPTCLYCGRHGQVQLTETEHYALHTEPYIQKALPNRTPGEREQIKTGIHPECFDALFGPNPFA